jgi:hypothetical protein
VIEATLQTALHVNHIFFIKKSLPKKSPIPNAASQQKLRRFKNCLATAEIRPNSLRFVTAKQKRGLVLTETSFVKTNMRN